MKLVFFGHQENYAVEQSLMALFPDQRPEYAPVEPGDACWAEVSLREDPLCRVTVRLCWQGTVATHTLEVALSGTPFQQEGQRRHAISRCFFLAAQKASGLHPPWGALTGVRPVKLPTRAMAQGATPEQARQLLEDTYFVSPKRAALATLCAQASLAVQATLQPEEISLYVGIPFCPTRCAYCSFISASGSANQQIPTYLTCLLREIDAAGQALQSAGRRIKSVYIGGGTPTTLSASQLEQLMDRLHTAFSLPSGTEFTVEAGRPDTITREKLLVIRRAGGTRLSVNPQTMSDRVLAAIGRSHRAADILRAYALVEEVFPQAIVNMDLIAGLPEDTRESFQETIRQVLALQPANITVHTLAQKRGARLSQTGGNLPEGEAVAAMLDFAWAQLEEAGYRPYYLYRQKRMSGSLENVGWCMGDTQSIYNICMMEELHTVLSLGAGGVTKYLDGPRLHRLSNPKYPQEYIRDISRICREKFRWPQ